MLKTAMHEIGHNLGFRHTNTNDGQQIHTTNFNEAGSIMLQGRNTNPSFQPGDRRAIRMYYPEWLATPSSVTASRAWNGAVRMAFRNTQGFSRPWYWVRIYKYNSNGQLMSSRDFKAMNSDSGTRTLTWSGHGTGTFQFTMRGYNFRKDRSSGLSSKRTVNL